MKDDFISFGSAIEALKFGMRVARAGWNGKGMFVWLSKGSLDARMFGFREPPAESHPSTINGVSLGFFGLGDAGTVTRMPCLNLKTAHGAIVTGWAPSQEDMLADDWEIVE